MNLQGTFWVGKWSKCLLQSCSLRPTLNFFHYIQSCQVHIHALFTCSCTYTLTWLTEIYCSIMQ